MRSNKKLVILIDFDGTLCNSSSFEEGFIHNPVINKEIVKLINNFLPHMETFGFKAVEMSILTARKDLKPVIQLVKEKLRLPISVIGTGNPSNSAKKNYIMDNYNQKEVSIVFIDDNEKYIMEVDKLKNEFELLTIRAIDGMKFADYYNMINNKFNYNLLKEEKLTAADRKALKDSDFGIPELRKFPLTNKSHIVAALRYFKYAPKQYKKELANNIIKAAKEYGVNISEDSYVNKYANLNEEALVGGRADGKPDSKYDQEQLEKGIEVEFEHTNDKEVAKEIAKDHLEEIPDYYTRLAKMEAEAGINEDTVFEGNELFFNMNNLKREKGHNILYITGLSGSGKSTLTSYVGSMYKNGVNIYMDAFTNYAYDTKNENLDHYVKVSPIMKEIVISFKALIKKTYGEKGPFSYIVLSELIIDFISEVSNKYPTHIFVVEGIQIFYSSPDLFRSKPLIVKRTSFLKSFLRMGWRDSINVFDVHSVYKDRSLMKIRFNAWLTLIQNSEKNLNESNDYYELNEEIPIDTFDSIKDYETWWLENFKDKTYKKATNWKLQSYESYEKTMKGNCIDVALYHHKNLVELLKNKVIKSVDLMYLCDFIDGNVTDGHMFNLVKTNDNKFYNIGFKVGDPFNSFEDMVNAKFSSIRKAEPEIDLSNFHFFNLNPKKFKVGMNRREVRSIVAKLKPMKLHLSEEFLLESETHGSVSDINEIYKFMSKNITYKENKIIKSPKETLESKNGDCHSQAILIHHMCSEAKIKSKLLFFIEYNEDSPTGGMTHTLVYAELDNKLYWIENAWEGNKGVHKFNSLNELKDAIATLHSKISSSKKFPKLEFKSGKIASGVDLGKYVKAQLNEEFLLEDLTRDEELERKIDMHIFNAVKESVARCKTNEEKSKLLKGISNNMKHSKSADIKEKYAKLKETLKNKNLNEEVLNEHDIRYSEMFKEFPDGGWFHERWNQIKWKAGKPYRHRCEVLVFNGSKLYMRRLDNKKDPDPTYLYTIPGGGSESSLGLHDDELVRREANEEARLKVKNLIYAEIDEYKVFGKNGSTWNPYNSDDPPKWVKEMLDGRFAYEGDWTKIYIADYDGIFDGFVDKIDEDNDMHNNGKFYEIDEVISILKPEHVQAIEKFKPFLFEDKMKHLIEEYGIIDESQIKSKNLIKVANFLLQEDEVTNESLVFSDNDYTYNFDNWVNSKNGVLMVLGLCGSGKSTLGEKLAKEYDAEYLELDMFNKELKKSYTQIEIAENNFQIMLDHIVKIAKTRKIVVEGIKSRSFTFDLIKNYAFYIKNTSLLTSTSRAIKRDFTKKHWDRYHSINPVWHVNINLRIYNTIEEFKKALDIYYDSLNVPKVIINETEDGNTVFLLHKDKIIYALNESKVISDLQKEVMKDTKPIIFFNEVIGENVNNVNNIYTYKISEPLFLKLKDRLGNYFAELEIDKYETKNRFEEEALNAFNSKNSNELNKMLFIDTINEDFSMNDSSFINREVL